MYNLKIFIQVNIECILRGHSRAITTIDANDTIIVRYTMQWFGHMVRDPDPAGFLVGSGSGSLPQFGKMAENLGNCTQYQTKELTTVFEMRSDPEKTQPDPQPWYWIHFFKCIGIFFSQKLDLKKVIIYSGPAFIYPHPPSRLGH